jgi:predicted TIM-barrel fold metal-dependent hydrolase
MMNRQAGSMRTLKHAREDAMSQMPRKQRFFRTCACCAPQGASDPDRRTFLAQGAATIGIGALGGLAAGKVARAQAPAAKTRIDVHHHFIPPFHVEAMMRGHRTGGAPPKWSPELSLEDMDKNGIATAILSQVQPGVWWGDNVEEARKLARELNEYAAKMIADHPGRFGLFAVISPPDIDGSLKEIEYALDTLHADGVGLLTSYQKKYLADASFQPVYQELNRRKAVVYVHPNTPDCCRGLVPGLPPSTIEFATDSTRAIGQVVFSGLATKYPDIRWIFSHSGGTLPFLTGRFVRLWEDKKRPAFLPNGPLPEFAKFNYELAQGNTPGQIAALLKMVPIAKVLYGTDYPFRDGAEVNAGIAAYGFSAADTKAIERENALALLPRLKA